MRGLEADVCVVGAGPAGLAVATGLAGHGIDLLLLESGTEDSHPTIQSLNEGDVLGDPYAGLVATRHRGLGGTAGIWNTPVSGDVGAKCVPLDPADFAPKPGRELSGWPIPAHELEPFYRRALALCGLTETSFEATDWKSPGRRPLEGLGFPLESRVYQLARRRTLLANTLGAVETSGAARIRCDATVLGLECGQGGGRVRRALVAGSDGARFPVAARRFVLAGGAVENARLLLVSAGRTDWSVRSDWIGRCFMEHPRDASLRIRPRTPAFFREAGFYDLVEDPGGVPRLGRFAIAGRALADGEVPNASGTLLPAARPFVPRFRRALGPLGRTRPVARLLPTGGHGWSAHPSPAAVFREFTLLLNLEQLPHPGNRIVLGSDLDAHGVPRAVLRWRWRPEDAARLDRLRPMLARALEATGLVTVAIDPTVGIDPNAHHHAGTTRMHADPRHGVVDADLRVHGLDNLYVAGASSFPTAGFANPLLTILALSLRLADHLAETA